MDLVSQVVACKDTVEINEIKQKLEDLTTAAITLRGRMENEFKNIKKILITINNTESDSLFQENLKYLTDSLTGLEKRSKNFNTTDAHPEKLVILTQIKNTFDCVNLLERVQKVYRNILFFDQICKTNKLAAAENLIESKLIINECLKKKEFFNFFINVFRRHHFYFSELEISLNSEWNKAIYFDINKQNLVRGFKTIKLNILNAQSSVENCYQALATLKSPIVKLFAESLFDNILKPLLFHRCKLSIQETQESISLTLREYQDESTDLSLMQILENLLKVFNVLNNHLNLKHEMGLNFIQSVGNHCEAEFTKLLILHHLSNLPFDDSKIVETCQQLVYAMLLNKFIKKDNLVRYMDYMVTDKNKCILSRYIDSASILLKNELLSSVLIEPLEFELSSSEYCNMSPDSTMLTIAQDTHSIDLNSLKENYMKCLFPQCHVSQSISEVVELFKSARETFEKHGSNQVTLWYFGHEIIQIYLNFKVPCPSPRHSALIFNNSMYLALNLILFGRDCQGSFPLSGGVCKLQNFALFKLDEVVTAEKTKLTDSMNASGFSKSFNLEEFPGSCDEAIRGCIQQLYLLKSFWFDVLSTEVYCMAMGHLCSSFIEEIILSVLLATNINFNIKKSLYIMFDFISKSIEEIMTDKDLIQKFVKNWVKWKELTMLFNANLSTVSTRWNPIIGSPTQQFDSIQMRGLVSALFPPTELREQTLAAIIG